jgi:hypothetical protein
MLIDSKKSWRVSSNHLAGIAMLAALAAAPAYVAQTGFAQELIARASSGPQARELIGWRRRSSTSWRVECIGDFDPYREARMIAERVESGARVYVGCPQVRIVSE